jgi:hypothetical protein
MRTRVAENLPQWRIDNHVADVQPASSSRGLEAHRPPSYSGFLHRHRLPVALADDSLPFNRRTIIFRISENQARMTKDIGRTSRRSCMKGPAERCLVVYFNQAKKVGWYTLTVHGGTMLM